MNSIITKLTNSLKNFKKNSKIEDIILFGSLIKGKENPKDIDILVVFKEEIDKDLEYEIKNNLKNVSLKISIVSKTKKGIYEDSFFAKDAIFFEGFSLFENEYLAKKQGYTPWGLFKYETKNLDNTKKTTFYYALNGRNKQKGLIEQYGLIKLSNNTLLAPLDKIFLTEGFFEKWSNYRLFPILIPTRLSKKEIIEKY